MPKNFNLTCNPASLVRNVNLMNAVKKEEKEIPKFGTNKFKIRKY